MSRNHRQELSGITSASQPWRFLLSIATVIGILGADCFARQCDEAIWTRLPSQPGGVAKVAYDTARQVLVWHHGATWESATGDTWTLRTTAGPAPASGIDDIVYDEARHVTILFHGYSYGSQPPETWQWDGSTWTLLTNTGPSTRANANLVYDPFEERVILFGGSHDSTMFNDTWAWNGSAWTLLVPGQASSPPPRELAGLAYDPQRSKVVLFGGNTFAAPYRLGDTWEFDGASWTQVASTGPGGREGHGMAYDPVRHATVVYGGYLGVTGPVGDTWEWDGAEWTNPAVTSPAGTRIEHGMVFHPALGRVVSVGGTNSNTAAPQVRTWQWTGDSWSVVGTPPALPPARSFSAMAYDSQRQRTVMYGGSSLADTWEFDGACWLQHATSGPGPRYAHCMAYDSNRGVTVLYGGASNTDTWEWNGATWSLASSIGPGTRSAACMAFDSDRGVCVLFGGGSTNDTWEWDGNDWSPIAASGPMNRSGAGMVFDAARHVSTVFGGAGGSFTELSDSWSWNGSSWTQDFTTTTPPARRHHVMAYDSARARTVLFGGRFGRDVFPLFLSDTWERDGSTWQLSGATGPSPRSSASMAFDAARGQMVLFGGLFELDDTWLYTVGPVAPPVVTVQPQDRAGAPGGAVSFSVVAEGRGTLTYQWRRNTQPLTDGPTVYGSRSAVLSINPLSVTDTGLYDVVVFNGCAPIASDGATLSVSHCPADFNADGVENSQDFFDFLGAFFAHSAEADFDGSGVVDSADFFAFLTAFFAGCP